MIMREFRFTPNKQGRSDFRVAFDALRSQEGNKISKEDRPQVAAMQRLLESVSAPVGDLPEDAEVDLRNRVLLPAGGTIELPQRLHEKLVAWVDTAPFHALVSIAVEDFKDRWSAADKSGE